MPLKLGIGIPGDMRCFQIEMAIWLYSFNNEDHWPSYTVPGLAMNCVISLIMCKYIAKLHIQKM